MVRPEPEMELLESLGVSMRVSRFEGANGTAEHHLMLRCLDYGTLTEQLDRMETAYSDALADLGISRNSAVARRFFCSDIQNATRALGSHSLSAIRAPRECCAITWIGQPPMPPSRVSMWAYHISDAGGPLAKTRSDSTVEIARGSLVHHWTAGLTDTRETGSRGQTTGIFRRYLDHLSRHSMRLADHVVRTWFYVHDVDTNYAGMVAARKEIFEGHGLTPDTHFIASTGIEGRSACNQARVMMDSYAIEGVRPEQIAHLSALDYLSPTHVYGVTFERATSVSYCDRKHIYISGTASIDKEGRIAHPGDVSRQLDRTLENVEALLERGGATMDDIRVILVYVRDPADQAFAWNRMSAQLGEAPFEVVVAPVCRPGWLIEVEGIAVLPANYPALPPF